MTLLLDTRLLLWAAAARGLPPKAVARIEDLLSELLFSPASLWEIATKSALASPFFRSAPRCCGGNSWTAQRSV